MGDELLKKTGAGNLFMVFGEPDIEVRPSTDDQLVLEIHGLDVYDPTTGAVRSSSTDDIAAWFLDTDYDGDAFFVRHAYFTGADDPYDRLRKALGGRHQRRSLGDRQLNGQPSLPTPEDRQYRREGDQPLRRRGPQGLRGLSRRKLLPGQGTEVVGSSVRGGSRSMIIDLRHDLRYEVRGPYGGGCGR